MKASWVRRILKSDEGWAALVGWAGIRSIGDLLDAEGQVYSIEYKQNVLELKCDFLLSNKLKKRYK